jgi:hypothetical protein
MSGISTISIGDSGHIRTSKLNYKNRSYLKNSSLRLRLRRRRTQARRVGH